MDNKANIPLPQLPIIPKAGMKRRGRPRGSKNKKQRLLDEARRVNEGFEVAFGNFALLTLASPLPEIQTPPEIPPLPAVSTVATTETVDEDLDDLHFGTHMTDQDDADEDEGIFDRNEGNIGFRSSDYYNVEELIELALEDPAFDGECDREPKDEVKQLKDNNYINRNSKISYSYSLIIFLFYTFKYDKRLIYNSWIRILENSNNISDEKKRDTKIKKTIRRLLQHADEKCPPIDFDKYKATNFIKYLLALENSSGKRFEPSTYCSRRSSLHYLYTIYGKKQSPEFKEDLSILFRSLEKKITEETQDGKGRIQTGKSPISYNLYKRINQYMLQEETTESVFVRTFLVITWNLIFRSKNTTTIHLHHLEWTDDCLSIYFAHMKNDQVGESKRDSRHVYANPLDPEACPILTLAIYFLVYSISETRNSALFAGINQYKKFSRYFEFILCKYRSQIEEEFGVNVNNLGVHSLRKGAASYVSSGATCSSPQVATSIRVGWNMGKVQDTYFRYESAGDQYVGHYVTGLPITSPKFAVLPAQFDCCISESSSISKIMFPGLLPGLKNAGRFLSASLLFHLDMLKKYFKPTHPLLLSSFMTSGRLVSMKGKIVVRYAWNEDEDFSVLLATEKTVSPGTLTSVGLELHRDEDLTMLVGLELPCDNTDQVQPSPLAAEKPSMPMGSSLIRKATGIPPHGIPPHVMLLASMQRFINSQHSMLEKLKSIINEEFDKREVGHTTFQVQKQVQGMLATFETKVITKLDCLDGKVSGVNNDVSGSPSELPNSTGGKCYFWSGKYRRVLQGWTFPNKMTLRNAWQRFILDDTKKVCALRHLIGTDLQECKNGRRNISSLKVLMNEMIAHLKSTNKYIDKPTSEEVDSMYKDACGKLLGLTENPRAVSLSCHSFIRVLNKAKRSITG